MRVILLAACLIAATPGPAPAQIGAPLDPTPTPPVDLIRDRPGFWSVVIDGVLAAAGWIGGKAGGAASAVLPPTPGELAARAREDDGTELFRLLTLAGYKLKLIENEIGIIPAVSFKFGIVRELSEADIDYFDEEIERSAQRYRGPLARLQRAIVRSAAAINAAGGLQVSELKLSVLPLPKVAFSVTPTDGALSGEASALRLAIQRVERRIRALGSAVELRLPPPGASSAPGASPQGATPPATARPTR